MGGCAGYRLSTRRRRRIPKTNSQKKFNEDEWPPGDDLTLEDEFREDEFPPEDELPPEEKFCL